MILFDYMIVFVAALEAIKIRLYEVTIKINIFKVGDGLIFGVNLQTEIDILRRARLEHPIIHSRVSEIPRRQ